MKKTSRFLIPLLLLALVMPAYAERPEGEKKDPTLAKETKNDQWDFISVNTCLMWLSNNGRMAHNPLSDGSGFEWPNGSAKYAIFTDGIIWGGLVQGEERVGGATYNAGLQAGPILADGTASDPNDPNDTVGGPIGLIGCEGFFYSDGPVAGLTGGEGFDYENWLFNGPFTGHTGTFSDWDGNATVTGGKLVTLGTSATRDYNGPSEGAGSDVAPTDARIGAVNEGENHLNTVVYFKAEMTRRPGATTSLIESDDFGAPRVAFGVAALPGNSPVEVEVMLEVVA